MLHVVSVKLQNCCNFFVVTLGEIDFRLF